MTPGMGFSLSVAFLFIFDAMGGALPFVFDATWMGNPVRWHLLSMQRRWLHCRLFSMQRGGFVTFLVVFDTMGRGFPPCCFSVCFHRLSAIWEGFPVAFPFFF